MDQSAIVSQLASKTFLTFGGNETYLQFIQKFPLREFCAFEVVEDEAAWMRMEEALLRPIADAAASHGLGLLTDSMVWRASTDYVSRLGFSAHGVSGMNRRNVSRTRAFLERWRASSAAARATPVILAADVGPRGDGYAIGSGDPVPVTTARDYHTPQIEALADAKVDLVVALTMTNLNETLAIVQAAERAGLPVLVSPTVETDGKLPDGSTLGTFVRAVDDATSGYPVGYMVNCAHPTHLGPTLRAAADRGEKWLDRFRGLRTNASAKSHQELDNSTDVDRGEPAVLARDMKSLLDAYRFTIVGGCCGTDADHLGRIAATCRA